MRPRRPWLLALAPLVLSSCGSSGATGVEAAKVIAGDWSYNSNFPARPDLSDSTVGLSDVRCDKRPRGGRILCRVTAHLKNGRTKRVLVVVRFDDAGVLVGWDFASSPGSAPA